MAGEGQQFKAAADIAPSVFVTISDDNKCSTAGNGATAQGIMHESEWYVPIPGNATGIAVPAGQSKRVYQDGEACLLRVGASPLAAGDKVMSDASGAGIAAVGHYDAIVAEGGAAGELARVIVQHGAV